MKQLIISVTAESEPVHVAIFSAPNKKGDQVEQSHFSLPLSDGATTQVVGLQEGETLTIS